MLPHIFTGVAETELLIKLPGLLVLLQNPQPDHLAALLFCVQTKRLDDRAANPLLLKERVDIQLAKLHALPFRLSPAGHRLDNSIVPHQNALQSRRVLLKRERRGSTCMRPKEVRSSLKMCQVRGALCKDQNFCQTGGILCGGFAQHDSSLPSTTKKDAQGFKPLRPFE